MGSKNSKMDDSPISPTKDSSEHTWYSWLYDDPKPDDNLALKIYHFLPMHTILNWDKNVLRDFDLIKTIYDIMTGNFVWSELPNEIKTPIMIVGGLVVLALGYEFFPLVEIPVWIAEKFALFDWKLLEWLGEQFVNVTTKFYVNPFLARLTIVNLFVFLLVWGAQELLNLLFAPYEKDSHFWYTYNFLEEYSSSALLNFMDPPSKRGENSSYPFFGRLYDVFCSTLVLPISGINFLLTPLVMFVYTPSDEVTATVDKSGKIESVKENIKRT